MDAYEKARWWWVRKSPEYPFQAASSTTIRPEHWTDGEGEFIAVVPELSVRWWGFELETDLLKFLATYSPVGATRRQV